jgi:hippurate hydrolase
MRRLSLLLTASLLSLAAPALGAPRDVAILSQAIDRVVDQNSTELSLLYQDIHSHPELSLQETGTAARLAAQMRKLGLTVTEHASSVTTIFTKSLSWHIVVRINT